MLAHGAGASQTATARASLRRVHPRHVVGSGHPRRARGVRLAVLCMMAWAASASATPYDLIPVRHPIDEELRLLETSGERPLEPMPLFTRPWQSLQVQLALTGGLDSTAGSLSLYRLSRELQRDRPEPGPGPRSTPRVAQLFDEPSAQRLEASIGVEGVGIATDDTSFYATGSGLHGRFALSAGGWEAYSHLEAAHVKDAQTFADPLVKGEDFILFTEESYVQYTSVPHAWLWTIGAGRERFAWGPGTEGSLLLSAQAPPLTGLWAGIGIPRWRVYLSTVSATVSTSAGEQMAAHRLEWEARPGLRLGIDEGVRYHGASMQLPYVIGVVPYTLVQRIQAQDEPDSEATLRNNVMVGADVSWRVVPGTRLYGELLIDDLHARSAENPTKMGFQLGWEGVGHWGGSRLAWGGEWTRISQYVYTSFFGQAWKSQDQPLGFATGPDVSRVLVWGLWDVRRDWQLRLSAAQTDKGEGDVDTPYVPGSPRVDAWPLSGQVETTRAVEGALRWWPASGVDIALSGGGRWISDADHVAGRSRQEPFGTIALRLTR